jgi:hypothetical protein
MAKTLQLGAGEWYGKDGSILAYNDENDNFKPLDFSFTRASTGTYVGSDGLIKTAGQNEPRVDYTDNTDGSLKLEPARTNLILESNNFDNYFSKTGGSTVSSNSETSPDGTQNADKVIRGTNNLVLRRSNQVSIGTEYAFSVYAKQGSFSTMSLDIGDQGTVSFNLTNEWKKFTVVANPSIFTHIDITLPNSSQGDFIYLFGAQVEAGSYATSYIPTNGSSATRVAETCDQTPATGIIGQTEGTMFFDCKINAQGTYTGFSLSDGTTNNEVIIRFTTTDRIEYYLRSGGSQPFGGGTTAFDTDSRVKAALAYKSGDSVFYVNGTEVASSTNTTIPLNLSKVKFSRGNSTAVFSGKTNNFKIYDTRLTNAELATLTT